MPICARSGSARATMRSAMWQWSSPPQACSAQIGRAHVWTPVTKAHLVCRLLLEKKKNTTNDRHDRLARLHHHDTKESQTIEQYNTLTHTCITLYLVHQFSSSALINISLTTTNYITHMCSTHRHRHAIHPI